MTSADQSELSVLAFDIGGTKLLATLIVGGVVIDRQEITTPRGEGPEVWVRHLLSQADVWANRYTLIGISATGRIHEGCWSSVNKTTLNVPDNYPLVETLSHKTGSPVFAVNDAQAAAWGEYKFGAGQGLDMVFLTLSTGIGGGLVVNGQLINGRGGLTGHFGQWATASVGSGPIENQISGLWMAKEAALQGSAVDAKGVFEAANRGSRWAEAIVTKSASETARLCRNIQMILDPQVIIIGGGIGLADGYLDRIAACLSGLDDHRRPELKRAALGKDAGVFGVADLTANCSFLTSGRK